MQIGQMKPESHQNAAAGAETSAARTASISDSESLAKRIKICQRGVTVADMCELKLAEGSGVLSGDALILDKSDSIDTLCKVGSLEGCFVYYTPVFVKENVWKTRKMVMSFCAEDRTCKLEEAKTRKKKASVILNQTVRYRIVSELVFKVINVCPLRFLYVVCAIFSLCCGRFASGL